MTRHHHRPSSAAWPNTSMALAYLAGLAAWVARQHLKNPEAMTMLPIGPAKVGEVAQVLRAPQSSAIPIIEQSTEFYRRATVYAHSEEDVRP
jgi:hypothetical protein